MNKKVILSTICIGLLYQNVYGQNQRSFKDIFESKFKAIENGGTLAAIDAYQDGIGAIIVDGAFVYNNSAMNELVLKFGEEAKSNGVTVIDQVLYGTSITATEEEKEKARSVTVSPEGTPSGGTSNGTLCDDGNSLTTADIYVNGVCKGTISTYIDNYSQCDDGNPSTTWTYYDLATGSCIGGSIIPNGCDDGNPETIADELINGVCTGILVQNGSGCTESSGQVWYNGNCVGHGDGNSCDDGNALTSYDTWKNNICVGIIMDGTVCDDGNDKTINDIYTNGICAGLMNGCNDGNPATVKETYLNGVCQGGIIGQLAINGLAYDNCEGSGSGITRADAIAYCSSKGMRLPTENEVVNPKTREILIPSCFGTQRHTWTSYQDPVYTHACGFWKGSETSTYSNQYVDCIGSPVLEVRCVK